MNNDAYDKLMEELLMKMRPTPIEELLVLTKASIVMILMKILKYQPEDLDKMNNKLLTIVLESFELTEEVRTKLKEVNLK